VRFPRSIEFEQHLPVHIPRRDDGDPGHGMLVGAVFVVDGVDVGIELRECRQIRALACAAATERLPFLDGLPPAVERRATRPAQFPQRLPMGHRDAPPRDDAARIRRCDRAKIRDRLPRTRKNAAAPARG
jgi:hypothetical protein